MSAPTSQPAAPKRSGTIATMVRLRWSLTMAALHKSVWQVVGYVLAAVMAVGIFIGVAAAAISFVYATAPYDSGFIDGLHATMVIGGSIGILFTMLMQLLLIGESSTMSAQKFSLFGIPDRTLVAGLYAAAFTGIPAICALLSLFAWSYVYSPMGVAALLAGILSAILTVALAMCFSKAVLSLAGQITRTNSGKNALYLIAMVVLIVSAQLPSIIMNTSTGDDGYTYNMGALMRGTTIAGWLPFGWTFELPFDAYFGNFGALLTRVALTIAFCALCYACSVWCIARERLQGEPQQSTKSEKTIGMFARVPDNAAGAISARTWTFLRRDPRQAISFILPVLFIVIFQLESHGEPMVVWQCLLWMGIMLLIGESNGLAYDGRAYAMEQIAGVRGKDDRWGRTRVYLMIFVVYYLLSAALTFALTGDWRTESGILQGTVCSVVGFGVSLIALGCAEFYSTILLYPVPSIEKPFSSPQGRAMAQGFFPFAYMLSSVLLAASTWIAAIILAFTNWGLYWLLMPIALANGIGMLWLGVWLGGKMLDARGLKILQTLDDFASLQK